MKKTVTVNIGGLMFHIDDDAYEKLGAYLDKLRAYFKRSEGSDDIIIDIETRIAEIFREQFHGVREVVSLADVDAMIGIMGTPEQYIGEDTAAAGTAAGTSETSTRRLFRDPDDKVIGGVCSGLGAYFGIDPVILRVALAISFFVFGTGALLYIVLWIAMPEAKTTAEKLQMKGERVNISNIERSIKDELGNVKSRLTDFSNGEGAGNLRSGFRHFTNALAQILHALIRITAKAAGVVFIIFGFIMVALILHGIFWKSNIHINEDGNEYLFSSRQMMGMIFDNAADNGLALLAIGLLFVVPLMMLIYAGIKMVFNIKTKSRALRIASLSLWTAGFILACYVGVRTVKSFEQTGEFTERRTLNADTTQTLFLRTSEDDDSLSSEGVSGNAIVWGEVRFDIDRNERDTVSRLVITRFSRGGSREIAEDNSRNIRYEVSERDSTLIFMSRLLLRPEDKFRGQQVNVRLLIPDGQKVYIDESMERIIYDIENTTGVWDRHMGGKNWIMTSEGLHCLDCTGNERRVHSQSKKPENIRISVD